MNHLTLDIETLGNGYQAPIVQIAAAEFNPRTGALIRLTNHNIDLGKDFYKFTPTLSTIKWWLNQSKRAQELVFNPIASQTLSEALAELNGFILKTGSPRKIWSHSTFDPPILMNAFKTMEMTFNVHYTNFTDIRTLQFLAGKPDIKRAKFGEAHDAVADCKYQAACISHMLRKLKKV